jgi:transposase-like protein
LIANTQYCSQQTTSPPPSCVNVAALWEDAALFAHIFPSEVTTPMTQSSLWQPSDIMSAEAGTEPEAPKRRGRIPQSAWPHILERHRAGATLSAIAREFDCTPSAISYIVRKAEASGIEPASAPEAEPAESGQTVTESVAEATEPPVLEETAQQEQPEPAPSDAPTVVASADEGVASEQPPVEPPAAEPVPVKQALIAEQAPEPRPAVRRTAPSEGRQQLRASDLGRGAAQTAARPPEPAPAAAPVEARPAAAAPAAAPATAEAVRPATAPTGRQEPAPPVDAVEGRLRDTARSCLVAYRGWKTAPGENSIQTLHDAVHELRKALARIEIDMSASRRDEQVNRPIPIPAHRAARRPR